jgi:hypothetical protein
VIRKYEKKKKKLQKRQQELQIESIPPALSQAGKNLAAKFLLITCS